MAEKSGHVGRNRILDVAQELFTEKGYKGTSIRNIADACGITNAALYYYFQNKEALFEEVMLRYTTSLREQMNQAGEEGDDYQQRICAMAKAYMNLGSNQRSMFFLARQKRDDFHPNESRDTIKVWLEVVLEPFESVFQEAALDGEIIQVPEAYSAASMLMGMLHGMIMHRRICREGRISQGDIEYIVSLFWNGLKA